MKKSLIATTGTLALVGALAGLGAFGGMAFAATPTPISTPPAAQVQTTITPSQNTATVTATKSDTEKPSVEEKKAPEADTDKVDYQEQGDHQGNNGTPEKAGTPSVEKNSSEKSPSGPDTDNIQSKIQQ